MGSCCNPVVLRKLECFNHALEDKRQSGVVTHLRLCESTLLHHGRTFLFPADPHEKTLTKFGTIVLVSSCLRPVSWDTDATGLMWPKSDQKDHTLSQSLRRKIHFRGEEDQEAA